MQMKHTNFTKNDPEITQNQSSDFQNRLAKLSPFQRPILPASYYPFHCKKESLKEKRHHSASPGSNNMPVSPEKHTGIPVICHQCGAHIEVGNVL